MSRGFVSLIGAGPGDAGLITVKGLERLRAADVILFDRLVARSLLGEARRGASLIDVGKLPGESRNPQSQINALIVEHALEGRQVVRLKGGDPFVFGRGSEEFDACREQGIACEVVPGVTSAIAVPAAVGIPVTARGVARSFAVITAHAAAGETLDHDFDALAKIDTLVVLMGLGSLATVATRLVDAGKPAETLVATIASGTTLRQRTVVATLGTIADAVREAGLASPVVTVIGEVVECANQRDEETCGLCADDRLPLRGRRVVVTQAESTSSNLQRLLIERGADVVHCPLIAINYPPPSEDVARSIAALQQGDFHLVAFTSVHGVRAFGRAIDALGFDARVFGNTRVAALGEGTAAELRTLGVRADLIPRVALAEQFVVEIDDYVGAAVRSQRSRILFPRGDLAFPTLKAGLSERGHDVVDPIVYRTTPATPDEATLADLRHGFDAILFCSPSAVSGFVRLSIPIGDAIVGCIGPTTAVAAREAGLHVDVVPGRPGSQGLVEALTESLAGLEVVS